MGPMLSPALPWILCLMASQDAAAAPAPLPLPQLGTDTYRGATGGLYPGGTNEVPEPHLEAALARARRVVPRAPDGSPDPERGLIGVLALGPSPVVHQFAAFERWVDTLSDRNPRLVFINGAQAGQTANLIVEQGDEGRFWTQVHERVTAAGLTPAQVQVAWLSQLASDFEAPDPGQATGPAALRKARLAAVRAGRTAFPADPRRLQTQLQALVSTLGRGYPQVQLCYLSDSPYGGHGESTKLFFEPRVFEVGFAVKWLIEDQIKGLPTLAPETGRMPLLLWGPYLWGPGASSGTAARWLPEDFEPDSVGHPSAQGERKFAAAMLDFLSADATAREWYRHAYPGRVLVLEAVADGHVDTNRPEVSFGDEPRLQYSRLGKLAFVRFDLGGVQRPVLHAKLSLRVPTEDGLYQTTEVLQAKGAWSERELTAADAPELGLVLGTMPRATRDGSRALDLTAAVNGADGDALSLALRLAQRHPGTASVLARETGDGPRLVLITASR